MQEKNAGLRFRIVTNSFASTDNLFAYSRITAAQRLHRIPPPRGARVQPLPASLLTLFPRQPRMAKLAAERAPAGEKAPAPFLCVHAKSLVIDGRIAFVGSYNLDPRSERLNTEAGLLVEDENFAHELQAEIERDMRPENSG